MHNPVLFLYESVCGGAWEFGAPTLLQFASFKFHSATAYISQNASWTPPENVLKLIASICCVIRVGGGSDEDRRSGEASFSTWEKVRVTNYSRHNMPCDCIITLWTIDVTVTREVASLPLPWWISPWLPNMKMVNGPSSLILRGGKQTFKFWLWCRQTDSHILPCQLHGRMNGNVSCVTTLAQNEIA